MDQLMGGITGTKGYASLQKSLTGISAPSSSYSSPSVGPKLTTTVAPLPQTISQRLERKLHYSDI